MTKIQKHVIINKMRKSYKYRTYINEQTENNAKRYLSECCFTYNYILDQRKYKKLSTFDCNKLLPTLKSRFPELKLVNSQVLQDISERIGKAFNLYFQRKEDGKTGLPRFKGMSRYDSFTLKQTGWKLEENKLYIKNIGIFNLRKHREIQGIIKTITVRRSLTGKWFICFNCEVDSNILPKTNNSVGIDLGLTNFLVDSYGYKVLNPKYLKQSQDILESRQQKLSKCKKGSKRRARAKLLVAKAHEKITNQRLDFLHKLSRNYVNMYDIICVEDLKPSRMLNSSEFNLNKHIHDVSWNKFLEFISYKAEDAGRKIIKVNPRNTSKICSNCKNIVEKSLHERVHRCSCGLIIDRDYNAAINILERGTRSHEDSNIRVQMPCMLASR